MFSALKRWTNSRNDNQTSQIIGHQTMPRNLQRKLANGVQYNMKIIIKGDQSTGKTCLFKRLQGKQFVQDYISTEEIQVTNILWKYKVTGEIAKVEIWDVVDKAKKRPILEGLKLCGGEVKPALDAEFVDVYKGTNGVILILDVTKNWTFKYVQNEVERIPEHIPTIVLANHCDMSHHRTVTQDSIIYFIESTQRNRPNIQIHYAEASMANGFGLNYLYKFFCLPFLQLKRKTLLVQLEINDREIMQTNIQLDQYQSGPESDYNAFVETLSRRRRKIADSAANNNRTTNEFIRQPSIIVGRGKPIKKAEANHKRVHFSRSRCAGSNHTSGQQSLSTQHGFTSSSSRTSVKQFVADEKHLDKSFPKDDKVKNEQQESDSDIDDGENPLVKNFQDDLDPEDMDIFSTRIQFPFNQDLGLNEEKSDVKLLERLSSEKLDEVRLSPEGDEYNANLKTSCTSPQKYVEIKKHFNELEIFNENDGVLNDERL